MSHPAACAFHPLTRVVEATEYERLEAKLRESTDYATECRAELRKARDFIQGDMLPRFKDAMLAGISAALAKNPVNAEPSASTQSAGTMESALNPGPLSDARTEIRQSCPDCDGNGTRMVPFTADDADTCPSCHGSGEMPAQVRVPGTAEEGEEITVDCARCKGTGERSPAVGTLPGGWKLVPVEPIESG